MQSNINIHDPSAVDWALLLARVVIGIIFMAHGAQKLFGAFGGPGLTTIVQMMGPLGYLVTIGEFFGGLGLLVGVLSRFSAASSESDASILADRCRDRGHGLGTTCASGARSGTERKGA